ncbi:uncharacterized protein C8R40DRAFT_1164994 [Lentinula edodes]|uniref:uncharacterized protein n=1 Tax=Lentinula edodes TaxID=5353 RepID=UPI001E8E5097|nr:uncharacterized protein C8R40DRAFT_1164994 [Lentinula edodes]KAH7881585.1 hypothetical protein C8R40DRAFT_1164994 [Lentinula edodes]
MDGLRFRNRDEVALGWVEIVNATPERLDFVNTELKQGDLDEMSLESSSLIERQEGLIEIAKHLILDLRQKLKEQAIRNVQLKEENTILRKQLTALQMTQTQTDEFLGFHRVSGGAVSVLVPSFAVLLVASLSSS